MKVAIFGYLKMELHFEMVHIRTMTLVVVAYEIVEMEHVNQIIFALVRCNEVAFITSKNLVKNQFIPLPH